MSDRLRTAKRRHVTHEPGRPFPDRMAQDNDELIGEERASTPNPIEHLLGGGAFRNHWYLRSSFLTSISSASSVKNTLITEPDDSMARRVRLSFQMYPEPVSSSEGFPYFAR